MDGKVDAQPLYVSGLSIAGQTHNVLIVVTENASAYAFDADTGTQLWKVTALGTNETPSDDHGCGQITPQIGITDTPVIDRANGPNGTVFFVAMSKDASSNYHQRLHALDLTTGAELAGSPSEIQASFRKRVRFHKWDAGLRPRSICGAGRVALDEQPDLSGMDIALRR